jgi:hypothetical protein
MIRQSFRAPVGPLALAALLVSPLAVTAAEPVALPPATGVNVDAGTLAASQEVMRGRLMAQGLDVRLAPGGQDPTLEPTAAEAAAAARAVGAGRAAVLRLVTLGTTMRARLTVYDASSGAVVHNDEMAADAVADLDPALERLAKGYAGGKAASKSADMDTLTVKESQPVPKIQATSSFGFRISGLSPTNTDISDVKGTGGGIYWLYDARALLIDLGFDGYWAEGVHNYSAGFGAYLPLTKRNLAPYVGGGARYAWSDFGRGRGRGFQPYASLGMIFGRLSTAGLRGEVEWWWNSYETGGVQANGVAWKLGVFL